MVAKELGTPSQRSQNTAAVTVQVDRNKNVPQFERKETYKATINENTGKGNQILRFQMNDGDQVVSNHFSWYYKSYLNLWLGLY